MKPPRTFFLSDLLGCRLHTAEGKRLGHVADIQLSEGPEHKVIALIYGRSGLLYRLHVLNPLHDPKQEPSEPDSVPWEAVERIEPPVITLKPGHEPG